MNKKIIILLGLTALIIIAGCSNATKPPKIELNQYAYDMGDVSVEGGLRDETFKVTNTGDALLKITSVSTSCGCTTAEVEKNELLAGESTNLKVVYDPKVHPDLRGKLKRIVYIQSNDPSNEEIELEVIGNQVSSDEISGHDALREHDDDLEDFEISPFMVNDKIKSKEVKLLDVRETFEYEENHLKDSLLLSVNSITQESLDELGLEKDDEIILYCRSGRRSAKAYDLMKDLGYTNIKSMAGGIVHWMEEDLPVESGNLIVQESDSSNVGVSKAVVEEDSFDFGVLDPSKGVVSTTFQIKNEGEGDLELFDISTSCGCTTAELDKDTLKTGEVANLEVFFDPNFHDEPLGRFSRTVFVGTNDPTIPELEVKIFADINEDE